MSEFPEKLASRLNRRKEEGALRRLQPRTHLTDFASNDYLGFSRMVLSSSEEGKFVHNSGSTGSRLISGNDPLYEVLEEKLAAFHGAAAALVFNSGYDANLGLLSAVLQRSDYIFYDESVHASLRDGISLGKARAFKFSHNDLASLTSRIQNVFKKGRNSDSEVYVLLESVYSMEGDGPDLRAFASFCEQNGFRLIVDEAHAVGILGKLGRGGVDAEGLKDSVFARIVTFGKAMGCHGAAVLGSALLKEYLLNFSRSLIYTTALPPYALKHILQAYQFLESSQGIVAREKLQHNTRVFKTEQKKLGLDRYFLIGIAAIQTCLIRGNVQTKKLASLLQSEGFDVRAILSPTVPRGRECLRFCLHSYNSPEEIRAVLTILASAMKMSENE